MYGILTTTGIITDGQEKLNKKSIHMNVEVSDKLEKNCAI